MLKVLFTYLLMLFAVPAMATAAEVKLSDVVAALETPFKAETKRSEQIYDFSANFFQESLIASIGRTQRGEGTVRFKFETASVQEAPLAKFFWEYRQPSVQEIISDGLTMWVYMPENRQVIESDLSQINAQQGENPVTFLSGLGNLSRDFSIHWGSSETTATGDYQLLLKPLKESPLIQQIEVVVSEKAVNSWLKQHKTGDIFPLLSTLVTDASGNRTAIEFRDVRVNQNLAKGLFSFQRPEGVELIDPAEQMNF
ncbi:outer membrane lipoprotein carrier protein [Desulfuromusa kysingii]|uniref:Outer membrane lipoprotein carrier protein n=1 Tax=Desulfuromusa kysingii TaxID=37625 RepID=A0A1H4ANA9_9BACT|nr:outer membrane lipoprotein carrier protein LolA [Desulfuromusa kysingii]SEA37393.1 outer membrane lipoprotein carrier protein [Desulfuromusa kysingii]